MYKTTELKLTPSSSMQFLLNYEKDVQPLVDAHMEEVSKDGWTLVNMNIFPAGLLLSIIFVWRKD